MAKKGMTLEEILNEFKKAGMSYSFTAIMPNGHPVYDFHARGASGKIALDLTGLVISDTCLHIIQGGTPAEELKKMLDGIADLALAYHEKYGTPKAGQEVDVLTAMKAKEGMN